MCDSDIREYAAGGNGKNGRHPWKYSEPRGLEYDEVTDLDQVQVKPEDEDISEVSLKQVTAT
jgi:hypothetical protein